MLTAGKGELQGRPNRSRRNHFRSEAGNIPGLAAHAAPRTQLAPGGVISGSPSQLFSSRAALVLKGRVLSKEGKIHRLAFPTHTSLPTPKPDQKPELLFSSCRRLPPAGSRRPPPGRGPGAGTAALPAPGRPLFPPPAGKRQGQSRASPPGAGGRRGPFVVAEADLSSSVLNCPSRLFYG